MKLIYIVLFVGLLLYSTNCAVNKTVTLGGDATQNVTLNYLDNSDAGFMNIEFVAHLNQSLGYYQTATAICFDKQNGTTDIQIGDNGFGLMFACYLQGGCDDGTKLHVWFFASSLDNDNPPTWASGGVDYSHLNTGCLYVGNGTDFDTTYKLSIANATDLTIPLSTVNPDWRCYFNYLGNETITRLDNSIDLSGWSTNTTWPNCTTSSTNSLTGFGKGFYVNSENSCNNNNKKKEKKDRDEKDSKGKDNKRKERQRDRDSKNKEKKGECKGELNSFGQMLKDLNKKARDDDKGHKRFLRIH